MNKALRAFSSLVLFFLLLTFTGCPEYLKDFNCISAQELTDYMNSLDFGTSFELMDSKYFNNSSMKMLVVYLKAQDMPDKTVKAYQLYDYNHEYYDDTQNISRTTFQTVSQSRYTDYYFVKYQDQLEAHFEELLSPLMTKLNLEKDKTYNFAIKPMYFGLDISERDPEFARIHYYQNIEEFMEGTEGLYLYCLLNSDCAEGSREEIDFHSFCYDVYNSPCEYDGNSYMTFYFTKKYSATSVKQDQLIAGSFYTKEDEKNKSVIVKQK